MLSVERVDFSRSRCIFALDRQQSIVSTYKPSVEINRAYPAHLVLEFQKTTRYCLTIRGFMCIHLTQTVDQLTTFATRRGQTLCGLDVLWILSMADPAMETGNMISLLTPLTLCTRRFGHPSKAIPTQASSFLSHICLTCFPLASPSKFFSQFDVSLALVIMDNRAMEPFTFDIVALGSRFVIHRLRENGCMRM